MGEGGVDGGGGKGSELAKGSVAVFPPVAPRTPVDAFAPPGGEAGGGGEEVAHAGGENDAAAGVHGAVFGGEEEERW